MLLLTVKVTQYSGKTGMFVKCFTPLIFTYKALSFPLCREH